MDPVGQLYGGDTLVFFRLDHLHQVQIHICGLQAEYVVEDLVGVGEGAYCDGDTGLLGDLEHAGAEVVELPVRVNVSFGEDILFTLNTGWQEVAP